MTIRRTIGKLLKRSGEWIGGIGTSSGYNAGSGSGRWLSGSYLSAPVAQTHAAAGIVARRSAGAVGNIPLAASLIDTQVEHCIPDMPSVRSGHPNASIAAALQVGFQEFAPLEFFRDMEGSRFGSGEGLAIMRTDRGGHLHPQPLPVEQLDRTKNVELADGSKIIAGVETDTRDQVVAYWIFPDAPDLAFAMIGPSVRVPADDVIHIFKKKFPGQRRGISDLTPVLPRLHELEKFQDNALALSGTAALWGGVIVDPNGAVVGDLAASGALKDGLEPGGLLRLDPGQDIRFPNMPSMADVPALLRHYQRDICAGAGVPYELATGDLSATNYSSAKLGLEAYKRRIKALRASLLVPRLFEPIYRRWVLLEILSGRLHAPDFFRDPEPYFRVSFLFPEWAALDPLKDVQADIAALQAGLRSRAEIIAARGRDIQDVDREIAADTFQPIARPQIVGSLTQEPQHA